MASALAARTRERFAAVHTLLAHRSDVDDLVVDALLADVREGLACVTGRPWNAVLLLMQVTPSARLLVLRRSCTNREVAASFVSACLSPAISPV